MKAGEKIEEKEAYWHWFCAGLFSDPGLERKLLERFGTPEAVYLAKEETLLKAFPSNREKLSALCAGRKTWDFEKERRDLSAWMSIL